MSFILDALKKSEIERQRQSVPGLIDTTVVQRRNRLPVWAVDTGRIARHQFDRFDVHFDAKKCSGRACAAAGARSVRSGSRCTAPAQAVQSIGRRAGVRAGNSDRAVGQSSFGSLDGDPRSIGRRDGYRCRPPRASRRPAVDGSRGQCADRRSAAVDERNQPVRFASAARVASRRSRLFDEASGALCIRQHAQISRRRHVAGGSRRRAYPTRWGGAES